MAQVEEPAFEEIAVAVAEAGADALSLINTLLGMSIDVQERRPRLGNRTGGLSGPAVKPVAVRMVYQVAGVVDLPLVGMGGIVTLDDALEFFMAGATCIQVGTATFAEPRTMLGVIDGLTAWMEREGVRSLGEIVGAAQPGRSGDDVGGNLVLDEGDAVAELQLALLHSLQAQQIRRRRLMQRIDRRVQIPVLLLQPHQLGMQLALIFVGHGAR